MAPNKNNNKSVDVNALVAAVLNSEEALKKLAIVLADVIEEKLKHRFDSLQNKLDEKCKEVEALQQQLLERTDELEQYQRRNSLRIFGVDEDAGESTDAIAISVGEKIGVKIAPEDIDRSHRVGVKSPGKKRPIIVKFVSYKKRNEVFLAKRKLKNTPTVIREDLTKCRLQVLHAAVEKFNFRNVWSVDGVIFVKKGEQKFRVKTMSDLGSIL